MSRDKTFNVSDDVKNFIGEIIKNNNWEPVLNVKYFPGSRVGDGYASEHIGVEIIRPNLNICLFVKHSFDSEVAKKWAIDKFYTNEVYFYEIVYPAYLKFLDEKDVRNGFKNAPKCYGISPENIIVLENLQAQGYALFDRREIMDEKHIVSVLKTFAKFHAISFAFKDQHREKYDKLLEDWDGDHLTHLPKDSAGIRWYFDTIQEALDKLDPEKDRCILERCNANVLVDCIVDVVKNCNEYSIIAQGDCWCNNILFKYEDDDTSNPIDVMIVDWQMLRPASPAVDVSHFLYTIASQESLNRLDSHLETYYAELSEQIKTLGSDPESLYPKEVFEKEWKQFCMYGFAMAFALIKYMLIKEDEIPNLETFEFEDTKSTKKLTLFPKFDNEEEYLRRLRILARFMVDRGYI
ncbi:hypothetical protein Trydic_g19645 [Trypoxylus dichotomus]